MDPNPLIQDPTTKAWSLMNPALPANPYVTIDYVANVPTNDAVQYTSQKPVIPNKPNNTDYMQPSSRYSIGRIQPYAASLTKKQTSANPNPTNNTFFQHNSPTLPPGGISAEKGGPMDYPFDWLVFLDRPLTNITEILNVPGTTPPQLTQRFVVGQKDAQGNISNEQRQQHLAPWGDQNARIYRALEFFTVGDRSPYPGTDGRVAGKIDINAVFDYDIANAFIDAQANSNFFTQQAVSDVWLGNGTLTDPNNTSFLSRKQVLMGLGNGTLPDKPFMSFAAPVVAANSDPQYPATAFPTGVGIANTILPHPVPAAAQGGQPTLGGTFTPQTTPPNGTPASITYTPPVPGQAIPPYIVDELLTKVSGHVTTRSNNFAVFLTVGFFEVMDDTTVPVKLGAELTTSSGKVIRHQMFAVVDRTNLAIDAGAALDGDVMGRLRQAPNPPTFMSLADEIVANPVRQGQTVTPINISVNGGLPTDYDGTAPVSFKTYQAPPKSAARFIPDGGDVSMDVPGHRHLPGAGAGDAEPNGDAVAAGIPQRAAVQPRAGGDAVYVSAGQPGTAGADRLRLVAVPGRGAVYVHRAVGPVTNSLPLPALRERGEFSALRRLRLAANHFNSATSNPRPVRAAGASRPGTAARTAHRPAAASYAPSRTACPPRTGSSSAAGSPSECRHALWCPRRACGRRRSTSPASAVPAA